MAGIFFSETFLFGGGEEATPRPPPPPPVDGILNFSKLNTSLNSVNTLKTLLRQSWDYTAKQFSVKLSKYWLTLISYSTFKSSYIHTYMHILFVKAGLVEATPRAGIDLPLKS